MSEETKNINQNASASDVDALVMRTLKMRAWDRKTNEMIRQVIPGYVENLWNIILKDRYVEILSTDVKDKNGTEIYDGDIIKRGIRGDYFLVYFKNGCYYAKKGYRLDWWDNRVIKVIGNRFENPELLKKCV